MLVSGRVCLYKLEIPIGKACFTGQLLIQIGQQKSTGTLRLIIPIAGRVCFSVQRSGVFVYAMIVFLLVGLFGVLFCFFLTEA